MPRPCPLLRVGVARVDALKDTQRVLIPILGHLERQGLVVVREEFGGGRTVMVPGLDLVATD